MEEEIYPPPAAHTILVLDTRPEPLVARDGTVQRHARRRRRRRGREGQAEQEDLARRVTYKYNHVCETKLPARAAPLPSSFPETVAWTSTMLMDQRT
jgi:hypothetical protein